ncbi:hypothetical protein [Parablautia muri]|uniref:hypothetical protein n=1 Tax=Parablautia muri TaxID=2320879 RepID=UPI00136CEF53|nr:hypothetical protein [Parablautia muri]
MGDVTSGDTSGIAVGFGVSVGCGVGVAVGCNVAVDCGVGVLVGVGCGVLVAVGVAVGIIIGDSVAIEGLSDTTSTDSLGTASSSIVNPNPIVLIIKANVDIPANLKRFLAGFFRIKLISAHIIKIGIHIKLMQNIRRNTLFI